MVSITVTTNYHGFWQLLENSWSGARDVLKRVQVNDFIWFKLTDIMDLYHEHDGDESDE